MNKIKYIVLFSMALMGTSCQKDFLDQVPDDRLTIEQVFEREKTSEEYLANVYGFIKDETYITGSAPWIGLSDEGDVTYDRPGYLTFLMNIGNWNPASGYYDNYFKDYYVGIRSATTFISNIGKNKQMSANNIVIRTAEARYVRAYLYFCLLRTWGPVTILGEDVLPPDLQVGDDLLNLPRNSYDECVTYITNQLDLAAQDLPQHFTAQGAPEVGRATKLACMALKSRVLLYAASPLFNGNAEYAGFKNKDGKALVNTQYDPEKWTKAAKAAKDIIDLGVLSLYKKYTSGQLDPFLSYRDVFLEPWNSEVIFARVASNINGYERALTPRLASGYASTGPPQQMVDAYHMANGLRPITGYNADGSPIINPQSGYVETGFTTVAKPPYTLANTYNMYANREPRFYVSVNFNGAQWINTTEGVKIIQTYNTGESGPAGSWDHPRSGYFIRKNVSPSTNPRTSVWTPRPYLMFRYAEILLNYIEALNETTPGHPDVLKYLNEIRERAGIPQFGTGTNALPVPAAGELRELIRQERRIELAFEHFRYFDTRRWKIAEQTDGGNFYGMNIGANPPDFYKRVVFEKRVFRKSFYLFPIPQTEINKNKNLVQNPGW